MKAQRFSSTLSLTSALDGGGWLTPRPCRFTPEKGTVPIVQEAEWASGPVWMGAENRTPTGIWSQDHPAHSNSLYRQCYPSPHAWLVALSNSCSTHSNISQDVLLSVCCLVLLHLMLNSYPVCWRGCVMHTVCLCLIFKVVILWKQSSLGHTLVGSFFFVLVHGMHSEIWLPFSELPCIQCIFCPYTHHLRTSVSY